MYFGAEQAAQSYFGPNQGGGSLPQTVMRTGTIMPFNARDVRSDIQMQRVFDATQLPTAQLPAPMPQPAPIAGYFGADAAMPSTSTPALAFIAAFGLLAAFGVWRSR